MVCSGILPYSLVTYSSFWYLANHALKVTDLPLVTTRTAHYLKSRRKGDLYRNARNVESYGSRRGCTPSVPAHRRRGRSHKLDPSHHRQRANVSLLRSNVSDFLMVNCEISARRFVPITPALPNGLKDVLQASQISFSLQADTRQRGMSLPLSVRCSDSIHLRSGLSSKPMRL